MNQIAKSQFGKWNLNTDRFNKFFNTKGYHLNSTSVQPYAKIFKEKLGDNKPLKFNFWFEDFEVKFKKNDADVEMKYKFCFVAQTDMLGSKPTFSDCLPMVTSALVAASNDFWHIDLLEHHLDLTGTKISSTDNVLSGVLYNEFLSDFSQACEHFMTWMNGDILRGNKVKFPYHMDELRTYFQFEDSKMHIMIDAEDKLYQFLETEFWDK